MQIFTLIPSETWASILILVIISVAAVSLRLTLYKKLEETNKKTSRLLSSGDPEGIQPPIVDRLRERYQKASKKLEHVNTPALIDSVYKEERVRFLFFKLQYDRADGITRALPNLLIAFGLIGTFWGITSNLTNISSIVTGFSESTPDVDKLVRGLQLPLRDMGVAFSTSLFGLLAGSILNVVNTTCSISIAKYQLISGLEDYLDNIYKPTVEGDTRLDLAVKEMVRQQKEFLDRFHEKVSITLETTFSAAADKIADQFAEVNKLGKNVYTNFSNAAGTISTGATTFQQAANSLENQTKNLAVYLNEFKSGAETFKIAAHQIEQNNIVQNIDRVLNELKTSQQAFAYSTEILQNSLEVITNSNETAAQLAHSVYQTWNTSIAEIGTASEIIGNGANTFSKSAISLEAQIQSIASLVSGFQTGVDSFVYGASKVEHNNIIQNIDRVLTQLNTNQQAFTDSTQTLQSSLESITSSNQTAAQLAEKIYHSWHISIAQIGAASKTIDNGAIIFHKAATSLEEQTQTLASIMPELQNTWRANQSSLIDLKDIFATNVHDREGEQHLIKEIKNYLERLNHTNEQALRQIVEILVRIDSEVKTARHDFPDYLNSYSEIIKRSSSFRLIR